MDGQEQDDYDGACGYSSYDDGTVVAETLTTDGTVDGYLIHWL